MPERRFPRRGPFDHSPSTRRRCSSRISSTMLVRGSRTNSAKGAFGRRKNLIRVFAGDKVLVEMTPYDLADMLAYPVFVTERDQTAEYSDIDLTVDAPLPRDRIVNYRVPIRPETLADIKIGQIATATKQIVA